MTSLKALIVLIVLFVVLVAGVVTFVILDNEQKTNRVEDSANAAVRLGTASAVR